MIGNTVEQDETWTVATLKEYAKTCGLPVLVVGIASVCVGVTTCATSCPKIVNLSGCIHVRCTCGANLVSVGLVTCSDNAVFYNDLKTSQSRSARSGFWLLTRVH